MVLKALLIRSTSLCFCLDITSHLKQQKEGREQTNPEPIWPRGSQHRRTVLQMILEKMRTLLSSGPSGSSGTSLHIFTCTLLKTNTNPNEYTFWAHLTSTDLQNHELSAASV